MILKMNVKFTFVMVLTWAICNIQPRVWWKRTFFRFQRCPQVCIICIGSLRHLTIFCQHFWRFGINISDDSASTFLTILHQHFWRFWLCREVSGRDQLCWASPSSWKIPERKTEPSNRRWLLKGDSGEHHQVFQTTQCQWVCWCNNQNHGICQKGDRSTKAIQNFTERNQER